MHLSEDGHIVTTCWAYCCQLCCLYLFFLFLIIWAAFRRELVTGKLSLFSIYQWLCRAVYCSFSSFHRKLTALTSSNVSLYRWNAFQFLFITFSCCWTSSVIQELRLNVHAIPKLMFLRLRPDSVLCFFRYSRTPINLATSGKLDGAGAALRGRPLSRCSSLIIMRLGRNVNSFKYKHALRLHGLAWRQ